MAQLENVKVKNFNIEKFLDLLKKAMMVKLSSSSENSIVFHVDSETFKMQSSLDTKSGIKFSDVYTNEMFECDDFENFPELYLPYVEGKNLQSALQLFNEGADNEVTFVYGSIEVDGKSRNVVDHIIIDENNGKMVITIKCTHFEDVIFVEDDIKDRLLSKEDIVGEFEINEVVMKKMTNMLSLDSDYSNLVGLLAKDKNIYLEGKNYKYQLCDYYSGENTKVYFQKDHLSFLEKEHSKVVIYDNRIVVKSLSNSTTTIISLSEEAE